MRWSIYKIIEFQWSDYSRKTDNLKRHFLKSPGGSMVIKDKTCASVRNVLMDIYAHIWELNCCGKRADAIENQILDRRMFNNDTDDQYQNDTHLDQYKDITKGHIKHGKQWHDILHELPIIDPVPSFYKIHRNEFIELARNGHENAVVLTHWGHYDASWHQGSWPFLLQVMAWWLKKTQIILY